MLENSSGIPEEPQKTDGIGTDGRGMCYFVAFFFCCYCLGFAELAWKTSSFSGD